MKLYLMDINHIDKDFINQINKDNIFNYEEKFTDNMHSMIVKENEVKHIYRLTFAQMKNFVFNNIKNNDLCLIFNLKEYQDDLVSFVDKYFKDVEYIIK